MSKRYKPTQLPLVSTPVTSANHRNARNNPVVELGRCTAFQLIQRTGVSNSGTVCILGNPAKGIGIARALIRRNQKPYLFLGTARDRNSAFTGLGFDWSLDSAQQFIPSGNGAIFFNNPVEAYLSLCTHLAEWAQDHFIILHLGNGLQAGVEVINLLAASEQSLVFCDTLSQSIRFNSEARSNAQLEFLKQMHYLFVLSSGACSKELTELLPTYQYENVSNTTAFNSYRGRSLLHPFGGHRTRGISVSQVRSIDFKKNAMERDELNKVLESGQILAYNALRDNAFLARLDF